MIDLPRFKTVYNLSQEEAERRVKIICDIKGYVFISFCDKNGIDCEYRNNQTHLKLYCKKCKKTWYSTTYNRFLSGVNCPNCKRIKEEKALQNIKNICELSNYTFLYFCDKNGNETKWDGVVRTYLAIKCNNCGNIWKTCTYDNFIRGRKCPKCRGFFKDKKYLRTMEICDECGFDVLDFCSKGKHSSWEECDSLLLHCKECGNVFYKNLISIYNKSKCRICSNKKNGEKRTLKENECLPIIKNLCEKRNYVLLGYCDKYGNATEWYGHSTYLVLKCIDCGNVWKTCTYYNFVHHLRGCPNCKKSHLENEIKELLLSNHIKFDEQKHFEWLGNKTLDFFIPEKNIAIECQGRQHFEPVNSFGGVKEFENIIKRDEIKKDLCEKNHVNLLYYSNLGIDYPYPVIEDKNILLKKLTD